MADADKCAFCGEIIPEGIQVCPLCSKFQQRVFKAIRSNAPTGRRIRRVEK